MKETETGAPARPTRQPGIDLERVIGYDVIDKIGEHIGNVTAFWTDHTGRPAFIGVKTFWLVGKTHVVPSLGADVNHARRHIRVAFTNEIVKDAPNYDPEAELDEGKEREVIEYFKSRAGISYPQSYPEGARERSRPETAGTEETRIPVHEEELKVGKRTVEMGGVRLRKVVRSETVQEPVEIKREDVVIERVPAEERLPSGEQAFEGEEIYIPLWREEPVVSKDVHVREEVRARKTEERETETVSGEVRKEEVEVEDQRGERRR